MMNRVTVRDAIQAGNVDTLQGKLSFDEKGDLTEHVVSVFQVQLDSTHPASDVVHQFKYICVALESSS